MKKRILLALALILLLLLAFVGIAPSYAAIVHTTPPHLQDARNSEADSDADHEAVTANGCGVERWSVKTGTDADAGLINLTSTTQTTIASLTSLSAPSTLPANNRIQPTETTVFQLHAMLTQYKLESDSDYHLVINDASGKTMITEIPNPTCVGSSSPLLS